uniref:Putative secreted protein n=1 Tax=Anopheles marajoara TaxID=58244 RepID=A0A2M4C6F6_9DIPT
MPKGVQRIILLQRVLKLFAQCRAHFLVDRHTSKPGGVIIEEQLLSRGSFLRKGGLYCRQHLCWHFFLAAKVLKRPNQVKVFLKIVQFRLAVNRQQSLTCASISHRKRYVGRRVVQRLQIARLQAFAENLIEAILVLGSQMN